jgi:hypothetical protein
VNKDLYVVEGNKKLFVLNRKTLTLDQQLNVTDVFKTAFVIGNSLYLGCKNHIYEYVLGAYKLK